MLRRETRADSLLAISVAVALVGCGGGSDSPRDDEPPTTIEGRVDIVYPDDFTETIGQRVFNPEVRNFQFLSFASDVESDAVASGLTGLVLCAAGAASTGQSREETLADGPGPVGLENLISQSDVTVNGREARKYLYIDPPEADNPNDTTELMTISRLYYFSEPETDFGGTLEVTTVCFTPVFSYSVTEDQMRRILDSVEIS